MRPLNLIRLVAPPRIGERDIVMSVFARDHIFGTTRPIFTKFLCMLLAVARSSSGGVVMCFVLPVL